VVDEPEFGWDNRGWYKRQSNYESEEEDTSDDEATNLMSNK